MSSIPEVPHEQSLDTTDACSSRPPRAERGGRSRRAFLGQLGVLLAAASGGIASATPPRITQTLTGPLIRPIPGSANSALRQRREKAYRLRSKSAQHVQRTEAVIPPGCPDETLYTSRIGSFSKGLPHNDSGQVDGAAFDALVRAVESGSPADFALVPKGGAAPLANPQAAFSFNMEGKDFWCFEMPPAPRLASAEAAGEMVELYWHSLTRDVPFAQFETNPTIARAAADLSALSDFRGPKAGGAVTPETIFRGPFPGDTVGPYVSQFLLKNVPEGIDVWTQSYSCPSAGTDYNTDYSTWLALQRGNPQPVTVPRDSQRRYLSCQRDLAEWVHRDWPGQAFTHAALMLLSFGPSFFSSSLPYPAGGNQAGFVTFGVTEIIALVNQAAADALRAAWYIKWCATRRLRPEAFAGQVHLALTNDSRGPFHSDLLESEALEESFAKYGSYLLSTSYPEGSPTHPSYPSGHATTAGACITILKAFFKDSASIPSPVVPSVNGSTLENYTGQALTVGGELNKLASNIGIGRNMAGIHYRSDAVEGIRLGEAIALSLLAERRHCYNEEFGGFQITKLDGTTVTL